MVNLKIHNSNVTVVVRTRWAFSAGRQLEKCENHRCRGGVVRDLRAVYCSVSRFAAGLFDRFCIFPRHAADFLLHSSRVVSGQPMAKYAVRARQWPCFIGVWHSPRHSAARGLVSYMENTCRTNARHVPDAASGCLRPWIQAAWVLYIHS